MTTDARKARSLDPAAAAATVDAAWESPILDVLRDYVRIPNVSPAYDPGWADAGHMERAVELVRQWCADRVARGLEGATVEVHELPGRTPVLLVDIPPAGVAARNGQRPPSAGNDVPHPPPERPHGDPLRPEIAPTGDAGAAPAARHGADTGTDTDTDTVLIYGHLDKQPPFEGWRDGLGPWEPVLDGDRLYGRGTADDGYAAFAALTAVEAVQAAGGAHTRCLVLIEASEESGSPDLPAHLDALGDRLGRPSLVIALDSGCADWDRLWVTTSLRGLIELTVRVEVLTEGVHSGTAGGVVPSSFRILRLLLDRIEDPGTGDLRLPGLHVEVPELRRRQAAETAALLGDVTAHYPFVEGVQPQHATAEELLLARTWRPSLEVTGLDGAPPPAAAGNVLRPSTTAKLAIRVPPTVDARDAAAALIERLQDDPPYGARVTVTPGAAESGWHATPEPPWLAAALDDASTAAFGQPPRAMGEGGTIPFMAMLGQRFPDARFVVTGVLGPGSNAHCPNEFLDVPTARRVTTAVAHLLHAHATRPH